MPAFEILNYGISLPKTKEDLLKALNDKTIVPFLSQVWPSGHSPTNYEKWKDTLEPYQVISDYLQVLF